MSLSREGEGRSSSSPLANSKANLAGRVLIVVGRWAALYSRSICLSRRLFELQEIYNSGEVYLFEVASELLLTAVERSLNTDVQMAMVAFVRAASPRNP